VKVLITGGSHVVALNQGYKNLVQSEEIPPSIEIRIRPLGGGLSIAGEFFRAHRDHLEITHQKFRAKFKRIPPADASYDVVILSTTLYSRPVWNKSDWAIYGVPGMSKGRLFASNSMLDRAIENDNRHLIAFLKHLRGFGVTPCVIEGPRPFRHNIEVLRTGSGLVKHIDARYRALTLEKLASERIPVVLVPDVAYDSDGFMLEKYRHKNPTDKTHGNMDFGRMMMLEVIRHLQNLAPT
jgi:hypothetical protein